MREESEAVIERYKRRTRTYDPLDPSVNRPRQELERALIRLIWKVGLAPVEKRSVIEIGCGTGDNLLQLLRLGFQPENLVGNELQEQRIKVAENRLPPSIRLWPGDAMDIDAPSWSFDIVFQSLVFSSLLDDGFQESLAQRMWDLVKPGGGVLWYDMAYNNPSNPDVRGVSNKRIRQLFPECDKSAWRITLAPPIARLVTRIHAGLYGYFNCLPLLRTHLLCWIWKKA